MIPAPLITPFALVLVIAGAIACFAGHALFRAVLTMFGFVLGALIGSSLVAASDTAALVVAGLVGGLLGALVLNLAYIAGVALVGAAVGVVFLHVGWRTVAGGDPHIVLVIGAAVAGAVLAAQLQRYVIIVATAFGGGWTLLVGVLALLGDATARAATAANDVWVAYPLHPAPGRTWVVWVWLALGLAGTAVQVRRKGKSGKKRPARRAERAARA